MRQFKAKGGEILDTETGAQIGVLLPTNCSKKLRDELVKLAVAQFNAQERGRELARACQTGGTGSPWVS